MPLKALGQTTEAKTVTIPGSTRQEIASKQQCLQKLAGLKLDTLQILANKAGIPGVEEKIKMYQNLI